MRTHIFIGDFDFSQKNLSLTDPQQIHQIIKVLRLTEGDFLALSDGSGKKAEAQITSIHKRSIEVGILNLFQCSQEHQNRNVLYMAVIKKERFEWLAEKATEVGIGTIIPIKTERSLTLKLNDKRLQKIMKEASEQSGRWFLPRLENVLSFEGALQHAKANAGNAFFDSSGTSSADEFVIWRKTFGNEAVIGLFIGPEGGWTEEEREHAQKAGCKIFSLGENTLRAETAGIVVSFLASL